MTKHNKTFYVIGGFVIPMVAIVVSFTGILGAAGAVLGVGGAGILTAALLARVVRQTTRPRG